MAPFERLRDVISGPLRFRDHQATHNSGMATGIDRMAARAARGRGAQPGGFWRGTSPMACAFRMTASGLEIDPLENRTLMLMMELLVQDLAYSSVVSDLNERGLRMQDGRPWNRVAVFNMTPRLIEVGPRLFSTDEWHRLRQRFSSPAEHQVAE